MEGAVKQVVDDWVHVCRREPGPLVLPRLKKGRIVIRLLSDEAIAKAIKRQ